MIRNDDRTGGPRPNVPPKVDRIKRIGKMFVRMNLTQKSLDCCGGALVDACTAVDAFSCVDDSDIIAGDCTLGADVNTCSTCHTLGLFDCNHLNH